MKIIDAHLHFWPGEPYFDEIALAAEHQNTEKHLYEQYQAHEIIMGIVMGYLQMKRSLEIWSKSYLIYAQYIEKKNSQEVIDDLREQ